MCAAVLFDVLVVVIRFDFVQNAIQTIQNNTQCTKVHAQCCARLLPVLHNGRVFGAMPPHALVSTTARVRFMESPAPQRCSRVEQVAAPAWVAWAIGD